MKNQKVVSIKLVKNSIDRELNEMNRSVLLHVLRPKDIKFDDSILKV